MASWTRFRTEALAFGDFLVDPHPVPNWRALFEPRIVSIGGGSIWLRGFERVGTAAVVQAPRRAARHQAGRPLRPAVG